jgi:hypothetical protein
MTHRWWWRRCIGRYAKVSRDKVRQLGRRQGMEEALEHHDEGPCDGCEGSNELRSELFAN